MAGHLFRLQTLSVIGLSPGHSLASRMTSSSWLILCLQTTLLVFRPPPHVWLQRLHSLTSQLKYVIKAVRVCPESSGIHIAEVYTRVFSVHMWPTAQLNNHENIWKQNFLYHLRKQVVKEESFFSRLLVFLSVTFFMSACLIGALLFEIKFQGHNGGRTASINGTALGLHWYFYYLLVQVWTIPKDNPNLLWKLSCSSLRNQWLKNLHRSLLALLPVTEACYFETIMPITNW